MSARPVDQIVEIFLRATQCLAVGVLPHAPDEEIGIKSLFQREHLDLKFFFHQQAQRALGGLSPSRIRIEVDDDVLAESPEQFRLDLGERRA